MLWVKGNPGREINLTFPGVDCPFLLVVCQRFNAGTSFGREELSYENPGAILGSDYCLRCFSTRSLSDAGT